jgi:transcriptional regulator NrdR family protein
MFLCPNCLRPAIAGQTINEVESTGQVVYRMRYCKCCSLRIKTKEEIVETTYYIRRESKKDVEEDHD